MFVLNFDTREERSCPKWTFASELKLQVVSRVGRFLSPNTSLTLHHQSSLSHDSCVLVVERDRSVWAAFVCLCVCAWCRCMHGCVYGP